ncbi:hypothetical protein E4U51_001868 [Claviceps purpurea]|nr:hypothetical protein E4U51_001868 [Claviceps purpurea]
MNLLLSPQRPVFPHHHDNAYRSSHRPASPLCRMSNRKRKADHDGDEPMSLVKKLRTNEITGQPLSLPRLLETLDAKELRASLGRICERHPSIEQEVVAGAPRPSVQSSLNVLREYQKKVNEAVPYGETSAEYTYHRVKEPLLAFITAISDFTPHYLPPNETQASKSLDFLDGATNLIHDLPNWDPQSYCHHKENAYDEMSRAWALVISEAGKRGGGINLHSGGWPQSLTRHNDRSGGRLSSAMTAMANSIGWMGSGSSASGNSSEQNSILNQLMSGAYSSPVPVGPRPGDQHTAWANPFEEKRPRVSEWTAKEIASIASKLDKQLGPEYISSRSGPGGSRVHYLTAEKVIGLANEVFGFNGWSSSIQNIQVDFADENPQTQRVSIGLSVIVRITLRDGTYHEDIGYGSIENAKGKAIAFEKAKKEGTTDGMKRALRNFGNVLGNCIYDTDFVKQVTKVKAQPVRKFDQDNLHRHSDFIKRDVPLPEGPPTGAGGRNTANGLEPAPAALKLDPTESFEDYLGELDEADFCVSEEGHPDEIILPNPAPAQAQQHSRQTSNGPAQGQAQAQTEAVGRQQPSRSVVSGGAALRPPKTPNTGHMQPGNSSREPSGVNAMAAPPVPNAGGAETVAFFSARAVARSAEAKEPVLASSQLFNPKAESPSIRKTPGIDHSSSKPLARNGQHVAPTPSSQAVLAPVSNATGFTSVRPGGSITGGSLTNPSLDHTRRIGAPGGPGSPLANRSSYKPPTMKRPLAGDGSTTGSARPPLLDLPANAGGQGNGVSSKATLAGDGMEPKRQKTAQ